MERQIIEIHETKCNGCGDCIPGCPEGALKIIDGKARLVAEVMCDGLGACLGRCPQGAITITRKVAAAYDEQLVMQNMLRQGSEAVTAHLEHLRAHQDHANLKLAESMLSHQPPPAKSGQTAPATSGCPGSRAQVFSPLAFSLSASPARTTRSTASALTHWPVQLHLINPTSPAYRGADVLLAADCTAFATGGFHSQFLPGKSLVIACPKLDHNQEAYESKLAAMMDQAEIKSLTVMIMEVPCCGGLLATALAARRRAARPVPLKRIIISVRGELLEEAWMEK